MNCVPFHPALGFILAHPEPRSLHTWKLGSEDRATSPGAAPPSAWSGAPRERALPPCASDGVPCAPPASGCRFRIGGARVQHGVRHEILLEPGLAHQGAPSSPAQLGQGMPSIRAWGSQGCLLWTLVYLALSPGQLQGGNLYQYQNLYGIGNCSTLSLISSVHKVKV